MQNRVIVPLIALFFTNAAAADGKAKTASGSGARSSEKAASSAAAPFVGAELGSPWSANAVSIAKAKKTYDLTSPFPGAGVMATLRSGYLKAQSRILTALGGGLSYGQYTAKGSAYDKGDVSLTLSAAYAMLFMRVGYVFDRRFSGLVGVESYHPLAESITMKSPTGNAKATPDGGLEIATHATSLTLRYSLTSKLTADGTLYIGSIVYSALQGRGFNGLTAGVNYAL